MCVRMHARNFMSLGDVWRHFGLSHRGGGVLLAHTVGEATGAAKHPAKGGPCKENHLVSGVARAVVLLCRDPLYRMSP